MGGLPSLLLEYVGYMGALALLSWRWERHYGRDAFGLVSAVAITILVVTGLVEVFDASVEWALALGAATGALVFLSLEWATDRFGFSLLEVLFVATAALLAFDGVTQHSPVALGSAARHIVPWLLGLSAAVWAWELFGNLPIERLTRRIGRESRWAMPYWREGWLSDKSLPWLALLLFVPVAGLPLATTGVLSTTLLKDVALAILLARVTGSRSPGFLLLMTATLGMARLGVGYFFAGGAGPPLVEAAAFIAALLWLRQKGFRAAFATGVTRAVD